MEEKKHGNQRLFLGVVVLFLFALFSVGAYAHEAENEHVETASPNESYSSFSIIMILISSLIIGVVVFVSLVYEKKVQSLKVPLFLGIVLPAIITTFFIAGSTVYLNMLSVAKGPVHWHADFEVYQCGGKISLVESQGFSNRVGTSNFHSHNDNRIHVEGVVIDPAEISLQNFFNVLGGFMGHEYLKVPTNEGFIELKNGDLCNGKPAKLQVFLYKTEQGIMHQEKLEQFETYVLSPYSVVPSGDCLIIEFDEDKEKTDYLCETYGSALKRGEIRGS